MNANRVILPLGLVVATLAGCLGAPGTEAESGAESAQGMRLGVQWLTPKGWGLARRWMFGSSEAGRASQLVIDLGAIGLGESAQPIAVTPQPEESLALAGDAYLLQYGGPGRVALNAQTDGAPFSPTQVLTSFGLVVRHRPAGSRYAWRAIAAKDASGAAYGERWFRSPLFVDYDSQGFSAMDESGNWGWLSFADAGVAAGRPELLVTAMPTDDPGSLAGSYDWGIEALCGGDLCPASDADETAQTWGDVYPGEAWIGIGMKQLSDRDEEALLAFLSVDSVVVVSSVVAGSPADGAGLRAGDVISSVDGGAATARSVRNATAHAGVGGTIQLAVFAHGDATPRIVSVTVGAAPDYRTAAAR